MTSETPVPAMTLSIVPVEEESPVRVRVLAPEKMKLAVEFSSSVLLLMTSRVPPPAPILVLRPRAAVSLLKRNVPPSRTTCPPLLLRLPRLVEPKPVGEPCP